MVRKLSVLFCILVLLTGCSAPETAEFIPPLPEAVSLPEAAPTSAGDPLPLPSAAQDVPLPADDVALVPDWEQLTEWQKAYIALLGEEEARRKDYPSEVREFFEEEYMLYDIDEDGIPELFFKFGNAESNYTCQVFTWQDGQVKEAGTLDYWHCALYTWPGENAVLQRYGFSYQGFSLVDGSLVRIPVNRDVPWESSSVYDIPPPNVVIPGAQWLEMYKVMVELPRHEPLILPILDYIAEPPDPLPPDKAAAAEQAIQAVLAGDGPMYHIPGDNYIRGLGWTTFADFCASGSDPYQSQTAPLEIVDTLWQDLNGDGARECILCLRKIGGEARHLMILSAQGGVVYAMETTSWQWGWPDENGVFWPEDEYDSPFRISFRQNQCYTFYAVE